jgi:hypothetical protein
MTINFKEHGTNETMKTIGLIGYIASNNHQHLEYKSGLSYTFPLFPDYKNLDYNTNTQEEELMNYIVVTPQQRVKMC